MEVLVTEDGFRVILSNLLVGAIIIALTFSAINSLVSAYKNYVEARGIKAHGKEWEKAHR